MTGHETNSHNLGVLNILGIWVHVGHFYFYYIYVIFYLFIKFYKKFCELGRGLDGVVCVLSVSPLLFNTN